MSRIEHLTYNAENDQYICPDSLTLTYQYIRRSKSANDYEIQKRVFCNESCSGCPYREQCHRSKHDQRTVKVSHTFEALGS